MTGPDALATIAEIAIAITGFSGIAAVLGRDRRGNRADWTPMDAYRLQALLFSSFVAVVFSFLPIVLLLTTLAPPVVWSVSSGTWLVALALIAVVRGREVRRITRETGESIERFDYVFFGVPLLAMLILHVTNVVAVRGAWAYVGAAICALTISFAFFVRLLRVILRPGAA